MFHHPPPPPEPTKPLPPESNYSGAPVRAEDVLAYVADCLAHNSTPAEVRKQLVAMGYSVKDAGHFVQAAQDQGWRTSPGAYPGTDAARAAGKRNMVIGAIVCVVGLVITLGSLAAASNSGGGGYVVAWGAIVFGAIQFFRGAAQAGSGSSAAG